MRKIKYIIPIVLLFMVIGFATITTSLSIDANMGILGDLDDFTIYYSRAVVNGVEDSSIIVSPTELDFGAALKTVGTTYTIEYDITNASAAFDAEITITCSGSTEYFEVANSFDSSTPLGARQTRTGTLTLKKIKTVSGDDQSNTVTCDVVATPVERNTEGTGTIPTPLVNPIYVGREIAIGDEKFNIISSDDDTVTMLAKYNVDGSTLLQTSSSKTYYFSGANGWSYSPGPVDIDISSYSGEGINVVNSYTSYIKSLLSTDEIVGSFITLSELQSLGCTIQSDYSYTDSESCVNSLHADWLLNGQGWWTRSAWNVDQYRVWFVGENGTLFPDDYNMMRTGIRPTITISKDIVYGLIDGSYYYVGQEISIVGEKFNVISQTDSDITLLAQYSLNDTYFQGEDSALVQFSDGTGWDYTPGPLEIDVYDWSPYISDYLNEYGSMLMDATQDDELIIDLITLKELKALGCIIPDDYVYSTGYSCESSPHTSWLLGDSAWWTRSARADDPEFVWMMYSSGELNSNEIYYLDSSGVRPVVTVSKTAILNSDYRVGEEVVIDGQYYNVVSDNGNVVSLLSLDPIGDSSYSFEAVGDWGTPEEYLDINIFDYNNGIASVLSDYSTTMRNTLGDDNVQVDLISLKQLESLGCDVSSDYKTYYGENCTNSPYYEWLNIGQFWWTKTARIGYENTLWLVSQDGYISPEDEFMWGAETNGYIWGYHEDDMNAVRPLLIVPNDTLENYLS